MRVPYRPGVSHSLRRSGIKRMAREDLPDGDRQSSVDPGKAPFSSFPRTSKRESWDTIIDRVIEFNVAVIEEPITKRDFPVHRGNVSCAEV